MGRFFLAVFFIMHLFVSLWIFGCAAGRSSEVNFYTLAPVQGNPQERTLPDGLAIAVGPVTIPAALDRSQIVTRDGANKIGLSEYHRWAGPLQGDIAAVLTDNISALLKSERVTPYTRENLFEPTHRIIVDITRFDGRLGEEVTLDAFWSIKAANTGGPVLVRRSVIRETALSAGYDGFVAAQSKTLATLSAEIADAISNLPDNAGSKK